LSPVESALPLLAVGQVDREIWAALRCGLVQLQCRPARVKGAIADDQVRAVRQAVAVQLDGEALVAARCQRPVGGLEGALHSVGHVGSAVAVSDGQATNGTVRG
jgi:hypothetical protein